MLPAVQLPAHKTAGAGEPDTDFILYVIADPGNSCGDNTGTIAWASYLDLDYTAGASQYRPIAGITNVCKLGIDALAIPAKLQGTVDTMTHEIIHALARAASESMRLISTLLELALAGCRTPRAPFAILISPVTLCLEALPDFFTAVLFACCMLRPPIHHHHRRRHNYQFPLNVFCSQGFTMSLYPFYGGAGRNDNNYLGIIEMDTAKCGGGGGQSACSDGTGISLRTPKVVAAAKLQSGCSSLDRAAIENGGGFPGAWGEIRRRWRRWGGCSASAGAALALPLPLFFSPTPSHSTRTQVRLAATGNTGNSWCA
jgi:hypothetical protein